MIDRLCIIGVGLIGGSLAQALKAAGGCGEVVGCGRNIQNLQRARQMGIIDRVETSIAAAVPGADLVVVATPVGAMEAVFRELARHVSVTSVITDVGSTKRSVAVAARNAFGERVSNFVPGHPIAGAEQSGVEAARADLFAGSRVILTPLSESDAEAVIRVRTMWEQVGAEVVEMDVDHHDQVLAATSHLPHLLAFTLVESLSRMGNNVEIFEFAAGGFRDFTRIASSSPPMWRDICLANNDAILTVLNKFGQDLKRLGEAIEQGDGQLVLSIFQCAKEARDKLGVRN